MTVTDDSADADAGVTDAASADAGDPGAGAPASVADASADADADAALPSRTNMSVLENQQYNVYDYDDRYFTRYYDNTDKKKRFMFYSNKIDALINKIKNILQNDRDNPNIAEIINETPNFVRFKIYKKFLLGMLKNEANNQTVLRDGMVEMNVNAAKNLSELKELIWRYDIFDGKPHKYDMDEKEFVANVAAEKLFKQLQPNLTLDDMEFEYKEE